VQDSKDSNLELATRCHARPEKPKESIRQVDEYRQ